MKNRRNKSRVTIEIYDADGEMRESIGGQYTFREIRDMMRDIVQNDGIPVIRQLGKHEAVENESKKDEMAFVLDALKGALDAWGKPKALMQVKDDNVMPLTMPMVLEYKIDGIEFRAAGHPLDVHCANEALLKRVFEEEK